MVMNVNPPSSPVGGALTGDRRESVRQSVLRASRAVAGILLVALLLGVAMVLASYRARQSQRRAEAAEMVARDQLWTASLAQARAERLNVNAGHRAAALSALSNAAAIRPSAELRDEAIAAFGIRDLVREASWPLRPGAYGFFFDPALEYYVVRYATDELSMFRMRDNSLVRTFRAAAAGLGPNAVLTEFNFSATGRLLVTYYSNGAMVVWERDSGKPLQTFGLVPGDERPAWRPTFKDDDSVMFARSATQRDRVLLIQPITGETRSLTVPGVNETVRLSQTGDRFAWSRGRELFIHEAVSGTLIQTVPWPENVLSFRWDWSGRQISLWLRDSTVRIWEVPGGRARQLGGKLVGPWVQQFSPDGTLLVTAGDDGTTRLWDVSESRVVAQTLEARAFAFGRDGERIAFAIPGREVGIWRITRPTGHRLLQGAVTERATVWRQDLSRDGRWLVWATPPWVNRPGFELFDLAGGREPRWVGQPSHVMAGFHPSEPRVTIINRDGLREYSLPGVEGAADELGAPQTIPVPAGLQPYSFAYGADGRHLVLADVRGGLFVLDQTKPGQWVSLEGGLRTPDLPGPASVTGSGGLAMSPDGRWVVAGRDTSNGRATLWDATTGKAVRTLAEDKVHATFSADGRWLALAGVKECALWSVGDWQRRWSLPRAPLLTTEGAAAISEDGALMAFARSQDEIKLVRPATGEHVALLSQPDLTTIAGLRLSRDGRRLVAASYEGRVHVWDLEEIRGELARLKLDWPDVGPASGGTEAPKAAAVSFGPEGFRAWPAAPTMLSGLGLAAIALTGLLGLVALRRHGRLTREFLQTTEVAAQQARELAAERELNELKTRFVSMVSHEFRTPLGITMSAVGLLRKYSARLDEAKRSQLIEDIESSTKQMAALMEQVLVLGRVESGALSFRPQPLDLVALCEKFVDESLSATSRRCPITLTVVGSLGPDASGAPDEFRAHGDESLLRHIVANLLSNAVKYSTEGVPVELRLGRAGSVAVLTVRDHGIGIPPADLPNLFQAFHRAGNVGDTPGTGLGLAIVKRCVELHRGRIEVNSNPGTGTTFTVTLPLFDATFRPALRSNPSSSSTLDS